MAAPGGDALQRLRESLPPYPGGGCSGASAARIGPYPPDSITGYCRQYGIDYGDRFPHAVYRYGTVTSGEFKLATHCWQLPQPSHNMLLLHGYFDHVGLFGKLIEFGLQHNCNVLAFDLPGHGLSSGAPAEIDDFGAYSRAIADVLAAVPLPALPQWVMAQSTGAAALIDFAGKFPWPFTTAVLLAPLLRPARWWQINSAYVVLNKLTDSVGRRFAENSSDQEFLEWVLRDPLQSRRVPVNWVGALRRWLAGLALTDLGVGPALVLQGTADKTVAWRYNLPQISRLFPGSQIEMLADAGHQLANESYPIRQRYLALVARYVGLVARQT